jgi:hypothetical protein
VAKSVLESKVLPQLAAEQVHAALPWDALASALTDAAADDASDDDDDDVDTETPIATSPN